MKSVFEIIMNLFIGRVEIHVTEDWTTAHLRSG